MHGGDNYGINFHANTCADFNDTGRRLLAPHNTYKVLECESDRLKQVAMQTSNEIDRATHGPLGEDAVKNEINTLCSTKLAEMANFGESKNA